MRYTTKLLPSRSSNLGILELNNPKAFHALTLEMVQCFEDVLMQWYSPEDPVRAILLKSSKDTKRPAFCSGGDVKSVYESGVNEKHATHGVGYPGLGTAEFFRQEYRVNHMMAVAPKPQISFWDGIVFGGGVGISMHGKFRVASENALFAMPETAIGLFPDVGSMYWMPRFLSPGMATYLALTGCRLKPEDLIYTGLATHYVPSNRLGELEGALTTCLNDYSTAQPEMALSPVLMSFHENTPVDPTNSMLSKNKEAIENIFGPALKGSSHHGVQDVIASLETKQNDDFCRETLETLLKMSPASLKVTLEGLRRGAAIKSIEEDFHMEFRMSQACMRPGSDFYEGIRAVLIDKDNTPKWKPSSLDEVTDDMVESFFMPVKYEWEPVLKKPSSL